MAAKRRGQPRKPKAPAPARERGRPPEALSSHPHRHRIAAFKVVELRLGLGSRSAAKGLIAAAVGESAPLDPKRPDMERQSVPLSMTKFQQRADQLRKLASRFPKTPADAVWLQAICGAILIAHTLGHVAKGGAKEAALSYAAGVGEERWVRETLFPWIDSLRSPADFEAERETLALFFGDLLSQAV